MNQHAENLEKAAQTANIFVSDLRDVYQGTETVAEEILISQMIRTVREISEHLDRLSAERKRKAKS